MKRRSVSISEKHSNMKKYILSILYFVQVVLFLTISCDRKKFYNPYDMDNRPHPLEIINPQNGDVCECNPPIFSWERGIGSQLRYDLSIDTLENFPDSVNLFSRILTTDTISTSINRYISDKTHYCRIRYSSSLLDPPAWTDWSNTVGFTAKVPVINFFPIETFTYSGVTSGDTAFISTVEEIHAFNIPQGDEYTSLNTGLIYFSLEGIEDNILYGYSIDGYYNFSFLFFNTQDIYHILPIVQVDLYSGDLSNLYFSFDNNRLSVLKSVWGGNEPDTLILFDISNHPSVDTAQCVLNYSCSGIVSIENALYINTFEEDSYKVRVYDITDIQTIQQTAVLRYNNYIRTIKNNDTHAYFEESFPGDNQINIFDISDPLDPIFIGSCTVNGSFIGVTNSLFLTLQDYFGHDSYTFYQLNSGFPSQIQGRILKWGNYTYLYGNRFFLQDNISEDRLDIFQIP
jgi:hypothetical protein